MLNLSSGSNEETIHTQNASQDLPFIDRRKYNSPKFSGTFRSSYQEQQRLVSRCGRPNLQRTKIPNKHFRYFRDLGNTLIYMRWRWILLTLGLANAAAYLTFSGLWMLEAYLDGDWSETDPLKKCVIGADSFVEYLLLSIETITTTGYGYVYPSENCRFGWVVMTLSTLVYFAIDGAFFTVVYVKITRPVTGEVVRFSKKAVICLRNGELCLVFRLSDGHGKHWIKTQVKAYMVTDMISEEGEFFSNYIAALELEDCGLTMWPVNVVHKINSNSPLWNVSADDLVKLKFEILVVVTGDSIYSGQTSRSQTSYTARDVRWGYRFENCLELRYGRSQYVVDSLLFNSTTPFDTPLCSAYELHEHQKHLEDKIQT